MSSASACRPEDTHSAGHNPAPVYTRKVVADRTTQRELASSPGVEQLLEWVDEGSRSYPETIDAWKSSCPRLTIWEDALAEGLIRIRSGHVLLTDAGRRHLAAPY